MPGCRWRAPAPRACRTGARSTSGASAWRRTRATPPAPPSRGAARPMDRPPSTPFASGTSGCASMRRRARPITISTSRCRRCRMATSPHGPYWEEGMKLGYQDAGSWTLFKSTPLERRKAAWLYAQFTISKTVSLKKSHVGLTIIRDSDIKHQSFTERAPKLGGLVEFYRSPDRVRWTPTGINVPDYPKLAQLWWQNIGDVNSGAFTPQQAMDRLAKEMDDVMARMEDVDKKAKVYGGCGPRLNATKDAKEWLGKPNGPKALLADEKPKGETIDYDELVKRWKS